MKIGERLVTEANALVAQFEGQPDAAVLAANALVDQWPAEKRNGMIGCIKTDPNVARLVSPLLAEALELLPDE